MSTTAAEDRWRLHRGGILNVWQYQVEEFDLSGGRAIFQGTNGSGKSRTLELLLPLCLDGDLRQMGSKGFDTVSVRRLMLDDYTGGPNRIGYVWIELRRETPTGKEFLTSGVGIKASSNSQQISDSWRFVTDRRVGADFSLVADDAPLGPTQLRDLLGADSLYEEEPFRARIAELVYGVPAARYGDLLHLQRTLRNPDVGLKVLEGQLEHILSDALPPLDAAVIEQLAGSFEDLESIRENIGRLAAADTALSAFLTSYRGYAVGALRAAAARSEDAAGALAAARGEIRRLVERSGVEEATAEQAESDVASLQEREDMVGSRIEALQQLPAYQGLREMTDRQHLVEAARTAAVSSLEHATAQRGNADRAVDTVLVALRRLRADVAGAAELAGTSRDLLGEAGLDRRRCPEVPVIADAEPGTERVLVRAKPDPGTEPLEIVRRTPPDIEPGSLRAALTDAAVLARRAAGAAAERGALTLSLHEQARSLDGERSELDQQREKARQAQLDATEATGRRNENAQRLDDAAYRWCDAVLRWVTSGPLASDGEPPAQLLPPAPTELAADPELARTAASTVREWMASRLPSLRAAVTTAERRDEELAEQITRAEAELTALRSGSEPEPDRPAFATAARDPAAGAPFYRLVDFAERLDPAQRAGCEAALQSSGLLSAWVNADGTITEPGVADLLAAVPSGPGPHRADATLADLLVPAVPPDSPVPERTVRRLLKGVSVAGDGGGSGLVVSAAGRWRAGVLAGAMTKPEPEFVGAGAREAARQRRIGELLAELDRLAGAREEAQAELASAGSRVAQWEQHAAAYPEDRDVLAALVALQHARQVADETTEKARALRDRHTAAADRHQAARAELVARASAAGMDAHTGSLQQARTAANQARTAAEELARVLADRCIGAVDDLVDALHNHRLAAEDALTAQAAADRDCGEYAAQAAAYDELVAASGGEARELQRQLAELDAQRRRARQALPGAREAATTAMKQLVKTQTLVEAKEGEIERLVAATSSARHVFEAAVHARGVWRAAGGDPADVPDPDRAAVLLAGIEQRSVSEDTVLKALQALQATLAGSHDITTAHDAGILTVMITGPEGQRPVADAAAEVAGRLAQQRGFLSEQYQQIFATFMLRDLAERLSAQIAVAEDLCRRMNEILDVAQSSQGVHVHLEWQPSAALDDATRKALHLVRTPFSLRTPEQDEQLRQVFTERITAERDSFSGGYAEILARALDYRSWYRFTVRVLDTGPDSKPRTRRMRQLSSGETRLVSYVTLFAAAAAFYGAVADAGGAPPLRMVLLDEAFERLDDPTVARMLGLLVDLDMDWIITWPSGWGVSAKIPRMHIYDVLRPKNGNGIACTHTTWDGADLARDS